MNKRWNNRKPSSVDLVISYPALGLLRGKAVNMSHSGMFIETAATSLCNYSTIELSLVLPELSKSPISIQATIIHSNAQGIGIMFESEENKIIINTLHQYATSDQQKYQQAV